MWVWVWLSAFYVRRRRRTFLGVKLNIVMRNNIPKFLLCVRIKTADTAHIHTLTATVTVHIIMQRARSFIRHRPCLSVHVCFRRSPLTHWTYDIESCVRRQRDHFHGAFKRIPFESHKYFCKWCTVHFPFRTIRLTRNERLRRRKRQSILQLQIRFDDKLVCVLCLSLLLLFYVNHLLTWRNIKMRHEQRKLAHTRIYYIIDLHTSFYVSWNLLLSVLTNFRPPSERLCALAVV